MSTELFLADEKTKHLNKPARVELGRAIAQFADDLVAEAGRLEANVSSGKGDPEITSSMVSDAETLLRRGYSRPRAHWLIRLSQVLAVVGGIATGLMADGDYLKDPTHLVYFVLALTVTVGATVAVVVKE